MTGACDVRSAAPASSLFARAHPLTGERSIWQEAAEAFCEGEVEPQADGTVLLSKIFKWYGADFSPDPQERVRKIAAFCGAEKAKRLAQIAAQHEGRKLEKMLKYKHYDWSSNSK